MAKLQNQKIKILYLMRAFWERSDERHPLTVADLIAELGRYDIHAERKSIYADVETLRTFGMDIILRKAFSGCGSGVKIYYGKEVGGTDSKAGRFGQPLRSQSAPEAGLCGKPD